MRTTKEQAQEILAKIQTVADARIRPMMGEYIVYVDEKVAGQINGGKLFIKVTPFGESAAPGLVKASPYPGAKPAFIIPEDKIGDQDWLRDFIKGSVEQLPQPKKK